MAEREASVAPAPSALAADILEFGEALTIGHGDMVGQPFQWLPFWRDFVLDVFDDEWTVQMGNLSVGRGGAKTSGLAVIALAALMGPLYRPGGLVVCASRSKEQAAFTYRYALLSYFASGFNSRHVRFTDSYKRILYTPDPTRPHLTSEFRALSADAKTNLGRRPWLVFHDELGSVESANDDLYDALSSGATLARCLELNVSTQAADDDALFSQLLDKGLSGDDPSIVSHLHAADLDDDPMDPATWQKANPGLGISISEDSFEKIARKAEGMPARMAAFERYNLNKRIHAGDIWIGADQWRACAGTTSREWLRSNPCWAGLDLASRNDLVALVVLAGDPEDRLEIHPYFWSPSEKLLERSVGNLNLAQWAADGHIRTMEGAALNYGQLAIEVDQILAPLDLRLCLADRWRLDQLREALPTDSELAFDRGEDEWNVLRGCGQGYRDMGPAVEAAEELVRNRIAVHPDNPAMNANIFGARVTRDPTNAAKIDKKKSTMKCDGAVAFAMAARAACFEIESGQGFWLENGLAVLSS